MAKIQRFQRIRLSPDAGRYRLFKRFGVVTACTTLLADYIAQCNKLLLFFSTYDKECLQDNILLRRASKVYNDWMNARTVLVQDKQQTYPYLNPDLFNLNEDCDSEVRQWVGCKDIYDEACNIYNNNKDQLDCAATKKMYLGDSYHWMLDIYHQSFWNLLRAVQMLITVETKIRHRLEGHATNHSSSTVSIPRLKR